MNNRKSSSSSYITPLISNLIHQTSNDDTTLSNTSYISYDSFCYIDHNNEQSKLNIAPVQGDDPPQRLVRIPSKAKSFVDVDNDTFTQDKTTYPPYSPSSSSSNSISYYETNEESRHQSIIVQDSVSNNKLDKKSLSSCLVVFDALEHTTSTARRGRPPVTEDYNPSSQLRFVKPTVCSVHMSKRKKTKPQTKSLPSSSLTTTTTTAPVKAAYMDTFMTSFTNSNMTTEFDNPIRKRGRKPKSQIQGNSFFVLKKYPKVSA